MRLNHETALLCLPGCSPALIRVLLLAFVLSTEADYARQTFAIDSINFNRDIKPILSDNCFTCHGPDEHQRAAGLRLDQFAGATVSAESGAAAIVPGKPDQSELIARITTADANLHMPPLETGKTLTRGQIQLLKQWIAEGAEYRGHWAFEKPVRPPVPPDQPVSAIGQVPPAANPIDHFIRQRLANSGLKASAPADRITLIRRVARDLTGLPPTPNDVAAFVNDKSHNSYEAMIDRYLASPAYGERMAISWLDYARYADSNGFQSDGSRDIWAWRDWVINAYNSNKPFNDFTVEQLAGDMLPNPTRDQIIATGFNRNHRLNGEGGRIEAEWFVETVIDRVETTGLTWMGLTLNCCRCHDHKYDPISQREFYQFFAFFNSNDESGVLAPAGKNGENTPPLLTLSTPETDAQLAELNDQLKAARIKQVKAEEDLPKLQAAWETQIASQLEQPETWQLQVPSKVTSKGGAKFKRLDDGSYLATGKNPARDTYEIEIPLTTADKTLKQLSGLMLETIPDPSLPNQSLGRGSNGNFVLTDVVAEIRSPSLQQPIAVKIARAAADYEQNSWVASSVITQRASQGEKLPPRKGWAIDGNDPAKRLARRLMLAATEPIDIPADATLNIQMMHQSQFPDHNVGRFRIFTSQLDPSLLSPAGSTLAPNVREILAISPSDRTKQQAAMLAKHFRDHIANPVREAEAAIKAAQQKIQDFQEKLPTTMVMKERSQPRDAFILVRGEYDRPAEKVERKLPAFLPPLPAGAPVDRLGLAQWIVSHENPLTARVWVNREWERFFGTGIVKTTENFGSQAEFPSHPELLDWLAVEFMQPTVLPAVAGKPAHPWDMKALQKLILMSQTYRQSSVVRSEHIVKDPDNRLLSRASRFRLTGELIRDQALFVSGLLVDRIGGPSVRPYMPEGVWDETSKYGNLRGYRHDKGDGLYRRTLYTIWKRTAAPPTMLLFDAPNREVCTIKRSRTNTPLQALALLNEVTFVEAARALATRIIIEGGNSTTDRINYGFLIITGRQPSPQELEVLSAGIREDLALFTANPTAAAALARQGESSAPEDIPAAELAAWTLTSNILLNLDEFVTRE